MRHGKMNPANTKPKRDAGKISKHTLRFREDNKSPIYKDNLVSCGAARRPGRKKLKSRGGISVSPMTSLPFNIATGLQSMMMASTAVLASLLPKSKRELKRNT